MSAWRHACAAAALLAAALLAAACTSVPHASRERDAEAKQFIPHPGAAAVYVYRPDFPDDMISNVSVLWLDHRLIGSTLPRVFFRMDVRAGRHELHGEAPDTGRLPLDVSSGEVYFVSLKVVGGNSVFERVAPEAGRRDIARCCVLLENWAPGQRPLLY